MNTMFTIGDINSAAEKLWEEGKRYKVWAFHGQMGAGKTTFIHALCEVLQVKSAVSSPTFAIINEYKSPVAGTIYHMDWYRLKDEEEAINAGVEDCVYSGNLNLIEWPEKAPGLLPGDALHIQVEVVDEESRRIVTGCQLPVTSD